MTGRVFVSGSNSHGQLGLGLQESPESMELIPRQVPDFADSGKMVACGENHTLVLSLSGLVYACGNNATG